MRTGATRVRSSCNARIGPIAIEVRSDWQEATDDFTRLYGPWASDSIASEYPIRMEVRQTGRSLWRSRSYTIFGDGEELFADLTPAEVLPFLEWGINYRVIATQRAYLQIHAATLAWRGAGVLLVGPSGSGKSTLTAALASRGWRYLSDEFALIGTADMRLHPFPKALCVKAGSFDLARRWGLPLWRRRPYVKAFKGRVGYVSPQDLNAAAPDESFPIRAIVFPNYAGSNAWTTRRISASQALFSLAANAFNRHVVGDRLLAMLETAVRGATCVSISSGDALRASAWLEELVENVATDSPAATERGSGDDLISAGSSSDVNFQRTLEHPVFAG